MPQHPLTVDQQQFVEQLLARMTLDEKIGQMTQPEKNSVKQGDVTRLSLGSVLSGGGGNPDPNTPHAWRDMVSAYLHEARASRLGIPLLYGVDAVHGHNNVVGTTIFPHNIALGATRDADLVRRIGRAIHEEPNVPNYYRPQDNTMLHEGLVIAVEPMISTGRSFRVRTRRDGWTLSTTDGGLAAHFEHTVMITKDAPLILTP